jgi:hypothetical protein
MFPRSSEDPYCKRDSAKQAACIVLVGLDSMYDEKLMRSAILDRRDLKTPVEGWKTADELNNSWVSYSYS